MLFQRLVWCALAVALVLGSVQSVVQKLQVVPLILAAEVFEDSKAETPAAPSAPALAEAHSHAEGTPAHEHSHDAEAWSPANGFERTAWTWVANVLHAFSMSLLAFAAMGLWTWRRGGASAARGTDYKLALGVAAAGWLSLHFWPSLGLHAEVPGMEAAALQARQAWWVLAVASSAGACAVVAFGQRPWRFVVGIALLALPFLVGAPHHDGDILAGFSGAAHAQMEAIGQQFIWATTWLSISFWAVLGVLSAVVYPRWLKPVLAAQVPSVGVPSAA